MRVYRGGGKNETQEDGIHSDQNDRKAKERGSSVRRRSGDYNIRRGAPADNRRH